MRRIKTIANIEKARRRNNIILGVIMILLLVVSTAGFSLMSADNDKKNTASENGFEFIRDGGLWKLAVGEDIFGFSYLPSEVEDIDVDISIEFSNYPEKPLYFVNPGEGVGEILNNLNKYILRYQESCLNSKTNETIICEGDLPIKDCSSNLIIFEEGNSTKVYGDGNCVYIVGDAMKGSDAFLYKIFGVY